MISANDLPEYDKVSSLPSYQEAAQHVFIDSDSVLLSFSEEKEEAIHDVSYRSWLRTVLKAVCYSLVVIYFCYFLFFPFFGIIYRYVILLQENHQSR